MNTRTGLLALSAIAVAILCPTSADASSIRQSRSADTRSLASPSTPSDQTLVSSGSSENEMLPDWSRSDSPEAYAHARLRGRVSTTPNDLSTLSSSLLEELELTESMNGEGLDLPGGIPPVNFSETTSETSALQPVPEPGTLVLLGGGLLAVARRMKSRRAKSGTQAS